LARFKQHGEEGFFVELHSRMRKAATEIKEKQSFYDRLREKRKALEVTRTRENKFLFKKKNR
jgi:hypothetical protein